MCLHTLEWPGLEKLPVCVIDPVSGHVYTPKSPVPDSERARLDRIEHKYVRVRAVLAEFGGASQTRALDTLAYLTAVYGPQGGATAAAPDDDFVHVDTLLALIVVFPWCSSFQKARGAILRFLLHFRESPCWLCGFVRRDCVCVGGVGVDAMGTAAMRLAKLPECRDMEAQTESQVVGTSALGSYGGAMAAQGITVLLPPGGLQLQPGMRIPLTGCGLPGALPGVMPGVMPGPAPLQPPPPMFFPPPAPGPMPLFQNGLTRPPLWPPMPPLSSHSLLKPLSEGQSSGQPLPLSTTLPQLAQPPQGAPLPWNPALPGLAPLWNNIPGQWPYPASPWSSVLQAPARLGGVAPAPPLLPLQPAPPHSLPPPLRQAPPPQPEAKQMRTQSTQTRPVFLKKCKRGRDSPTSDGPTTEPPLAARLHDAKKPRLDPPLAAKESLLKAPFMAVKAAAAEPPSLEVNAKSLRDYCLWRIVDESDDDSATADTAKVDTAKVDTAKVDTAKVDTAKVDAAKDDPDSVDTAEADDVKVDTAKVGDAKVDAVKVDAVEVDEAKFDAAKVDDAKVDDKVHTDVNKVATTEICDLVDRDKVVDSTRTKVNMTDIDRANTDTAIIDLTEDVTTDVNATEAGKVNAADFSSTILVKPEAADSLHSSSAVNHISQLDNPTRTIDTGVREAARDETCIENGDTKQVDDTANDNVIDELVPGDGRCATAPSAACGDEVTSAPADPDSLAGSATHSVDVKTVAPSAEVKSSPVSASETDEKEVAEILSSMSYSSPPISVKRGPHSSLAPSSETPGKQTAAHDDASIGGPRDPGDSQKSEDMVVDQPGVLGEVQSAAGASDKSTVTADEGTGNMSLRAALKAVGAATGSLEADAAADSGNANPLTEELAVKASTTQSLVKKGSPVKGSTSAAGNKTTGASLKDGVDIKRKLNKLEAVSKDDKCYRRFEFLPTGERLYRCLHPGGSGHCFDSHAAAEMHSRAHGGGADTVLRNSHIFCHLCDYQVAAARWYCLLRHLRSAHAISMAAGDARCCHLCGLTFKNDSALTSHQDFHYNSRYKCVHCGRTLATWSQVQRHLEEECALRAAAGLRHLGCPYCPLVFHKRDMRSVHALSHTDLGLACAFCSADGTGRTPDAGGDGTWDVWRRLRRHYQQRHARRMQAELSAVGMAPTKRVTRPKCHICGADFRLQEDYRRHMVRTHDLVPRVFVECEVCERVFRNERTRDRHARATHSAHLSCDKCSYVAKTILLLKLHDKTEHLERPHVCSECDKTFVTYRELKCHLVRHATHSFHLCKVCNQEFSSMKDLRRHRQNEHANEGRKTSAIACPECNYTCYSRTNLREHMKKKHPDDLDDDEATASGSVKSPDHSYSNHDTRSAYSPASRPPVLHAPAPPAGPGRGRRKRPGPQRKTIGVKKAKKAAALIATVVPKMPRRSGRKPMKKRKEAVVLAPPPLRMKRYACARLRSIENCRMLKRVRQPLTDTTICHEPPAHSVTLERPLRQTVTELDHGYCRPEVRTLPLITVPKQGRPPATRHLMLTPHVTDYAECPASPPSPGGVASPPGDTLAPESVVEGASRLIALLRQQMEAGGGGDTVPDAMQILRQVTSSVLEGGGAGDGATTGDDDLPQDMMEQQIADLLMSIQGEEGVVGGGGSTRITPEARSSKTDGHLTAADIALSLDLDDIELDEADYQLWHDGDGTALSVTPDGKSHGGRLVSPEKLPTELRVPEHAIVDLVARLRADRVAAAPAASSSHAAAQRASSVTSATGTSITTTADSTVIGEAGPASTRTVTPAMMTELTSVTDTLSPPLASINLTQTEMTNLMSTSSAETCKQLTPAVDAASVTQSADIWNATSQSTVTEQPKGVLYTTVVKQLEDISKTTIIDKRLDDISIVTGVAQLEDIAKTRVEKRMDAISRVSQTENTSETTDDISRVAQTDDASETTDDISRVAQTDDASETTDVAQLNTIMQLAGSSQLAVIAGPDSCMLPAPRCFTDGSARENDEKNSLMDHQYL